MNDTYFVSDGAGGREVPIIKKQDPFEAILKKPEAPTVTEKPKVDLVAGDEIVPQSKAAFAGKEEGMAIEPAKELIYGHCNNCRLELTEAKVVKTPISYLTNEDGSMSQTANRFSVFCKNCMKFITLIDQDAAKMLQEMIHKNLKR